MKSLSKNRVCRAQALLGTFVEITASDLSLPKLHEAVSRAFQEIKQVEHELNFYDPSSDVSALNREAFQRPVSVGRWCYLVLRTACKVSELTNGLFDCSVGSEGTYRDIVFLPNRQITFKRPLTINLGGIAKGFAVDQAVKVLKKKGVKSGCVNAGGDLRIFGRKLQPIYVRNPKSPLSFVSIGSFKETAFATSGIYFSKKVIHPYSKKPHVDPSSVSIMASQCIIADALTKPVLLALEKSVDCLKKFRAKAFILEPSL